MNHCFIRTQSAYKAGEQDIGLKFFIDERNILQNQETLGLNPMNLKSTVQCSNMLHGQNDMKQDGAESHTRLNHTHSTNIKVLQFG